MQSDLHYHCQEKGCQLEEYKVFNRLVKDRPIYILCQFCKTHQVEVCRCGWEFGWHYGTSANKIKKYKNMEEETKTPEVPTEIGTTPGAPTEDGGAEGGEATV